MPSEIILPRHILKDEEECLRTRGQITLVGSNGAGKTRFMREMMRLCGDRTFRLNPIGADLPELSEDLTPGSVDALYKEAARRQPYMRTDAVSQIDKLVYMLFIDEFQDLLEIKSRRHDSPKPASLTRLDKLRDLWERIFPGNRIVLDHGRLLFATAAGDDLIDARSLSQGEKTIFYHIAGALYAMPHAVVFVDSPSLFIHRAILNTVWNAIEQLRPDCTFVYDSVDEDFVGSRTENACIWIKSYDALRHAWDYELMRSSEQYSEELFIDLIGSRKPVLFIEGDTNHSLDIRLYSLVFNEYTLRPLGSCEKVIETTRSFNDLRQMHHLDSRGIVDRDRRTEAEVDYLRRKNIMVPEVAEIENIFLLEDVVKIMAANRGKDSRKVFEKVKREVFRLWKGQYPQQALQHVRHRVKRQVECKIDARFKCITAMETHLQTLVDQLQPRAAYDALLKEFAAMITAGDYAGVLRVFNHKPMLGDCGVARLLGYASKEAYISGVITTLKGGGKTGKALRASIRHAMRADEQ